MDHLNDLPQRHAAHEIKAFAEGAFEASISKSGVFVCRKEPGGDDYGTDYQLEVKEGGGMSNFRVHVQLKGNSTVGNKDGSVSLSVNRTTLNYLLAQPDAIFICYQIPADKLMVRYASDVFRQYEAHDLQWHRQAEVTVRFTKEFDTPFQHELAKRAIASGREKRDNRLTWAVTPPHCYAQAIRQTVPAIEVPHDAAEAKAILGQLFRDCEDAVISGAFQKFAAVLDEAKGEMDQAYMAEINLGINSSLNFSTDRVRKAIGLLEAAFSRKEDHPGSLHYCIGNARLALEEFEEALHCYEKALELLKGPRLAKPAAYCFKNKGSSHERLGQFAEARQAYEDALRLNPGLAEAHMALGLWHRLHTKDFAAAAWHFDQAILENAPPSMAVAPQAWKAEALFELDQPTEAFQEIRALQRVSQLAPWILPWCARLVAAFGRRSAAAATMSRSFWQWYLEKKPGELHAQRELFMCYSYVDAESLNAGISFAEFKDLGIKLIEAEDSETALIWDRLGHWAQREKNWSEAEMCYRKASNLDSLLFGSCLGVALNNLKRFEEALPILEFQASEHWKDALSWFHVAICREGLGDIEGCIAAYMQALELDPAYDLALFNLGGTYWNNGYFDEAIDTWLTAIKKFPDRPQASQALAILRKFFDASPS